MRERGSLSKLLASHGIDADDRNGVGGRYPTSRGTARLFDDEAKARILDASLEVLAALRALADVTEDILRERRASLVERGGSERPPSGSSPVDGHQPDASGAQVREQIPLTY